MIVKCADCGQKNRVPADRLSDGPTCGKCKETLDRFPEPVKVTGPEFHSLLESSPLPIFVDFWAPWCGPCKMVAPEVAKLAQRHGDEVLVVKLNTQEFPQVAQQQGVQGIPMFALFENGERAKTATGYRNVDELEREFGF